MPASVRFTLARGSTMLSGTKLNTSSPFDTKSMPTFLSWTYWSITGVTMSTSKKLGVLLVLRGRVISYGSESRAKGYAISLKKTSITH